MFRKLTLAAAALCALLALNAPAHAAGEVMKPFVLASKGAGDLATAVADTSTKLASAGFEIVGTYSPYPTATILIVTNDELKSAAAQSEFGGYGAAQRVAITSHNGEVQTSYTNPPYMAAAYRMKADLMAAKSKLQGALGDQGEFGPEEGMSAKDLSDYHYMILMPYFDDPNVLGKAASHQEMLDRVEANLAAGVGDMTKVYRVDIPGKEESVFGVALKSAQQDQDDTWIMSEIDFKDTRSTAHLPLEILVSGNKAYALSARFRIAINFPDLSMSGKNSFMNIMSSPVSIQKAQTLVAGGTYVGDGKAAE